MSTEAKAYRKGGKVIIEIPEDTLVFAAENSPTFGARVTDRGAYLDTLVDRLLDHDGGDDDGPLFFRVFDAITEDMLESADDGIDKGAEPIPFGGMS